MASLCVVIDNAVKWARHVALPRWTNAKQTKPRADRHRRRFGAYIIGTDFGELRLNGRVRQPGINVAVERG
jgi:hypothetical protein